MLPPDLVALSDALPTPLLLIDWAGNVLHANEAARSALNSSGADAVAGRELSTIFVGLEDMSAVLPGVLTWQDTVMNQPRTATVVAMGDLLAVTWQHETGTEPFRSAQEQPSLAARRQQALSAVTAQLVAVIESADVVRVVTEAGRRAVGAYGAVVYVASEGDLSLRLLGSSGYGHVAPQWSRLELAHAVPITDSFRRAAPLFLDYSAYINLYPDLPRQTATRSTAVLPLLAGQRTLGVLGLSFDRDRTFLEDERVFLGTLANQCAIALERAQGVEAARQAAERGELLSRVSEQLTTTPSPKEVLERLTGLVVPALAEWCNVVLADEQGVLVERASASLTSDAGEQARRLQEQPKLKQEFDRGTSGDTGGGEQVAQVFRSGEAQLVSLNAAPDARSLMLVPLTVRGQTLGVLSLMSSVLGFGPQDLSTVQDVARRAALALDNAALLQTAQASEARYRALTEATDQYVWTNSPEGEMVGEQPGWASLTGQTPDEYLGYGWSVRLHEDDRENAISAWHEAVRLRRPYEVEQRVLVKDGTYRRFLVRAVPLLDQVGQIREWVGLHSDVTQLREAELQLRAWNEELEQRVAQSTEELRAANAELDAFNHSVSHDLRAPVRHVLGFAGLLRRGAAEKLGTREQRLLTQVETSAQHMNTLIDELLAFARLSRQPLQARAVNLDPLVQEVRAALEPDVGSRQIEWHIAALPPVAGDPQLLKFVLINLLSNAVKYTAPRPIARIEVGAEQRAGEVVLWVQDNGVGFDPQYAGRLFGVFQRLHRQEEFEGIGIGLANVGRIVARHGGRVWAEGVLGAGATFFISLPPALPDVQAASNTGEGRAAWGDAPGEMVQ